jgi:hypothetical protein
MSEKHLGCYTPGSDVSASEVASNVPLASIVVGGWEMLATPASPLPNPTPFAGGRGVEVHQDGDGCAGEAAVVC